MILPEDVRARLMSLGPEVLFLGTRYLGPMMVECYIWPLGDEIPRLFTCPERAAAIAAVSAPWDCGRGGIIALDKATFTRPGKLTPTEDPSEFGVPDAVISHHVVGMFWLDDLVANAGVCAPNTEGPATVDLHGFERMNNAYWHVRECEERGVSIDQIRPIDSIFEDYAFGRFGDHHPLGEVYLVPRPGASEPGPRDARRYLDRDEDL